MIEPVTSRRQSVDLEEFERRLRGPEPATAGHEDPLAELARLVEGGNDPFSVHEARPAAASFVAPRPNRPVESPVEHDREEHFPMAADVAVEDRRELRQSALDWDQELDLARQDREQGGEGSRQTVSPAYAAEFHEPPPEPVWREHRDEGGAHGQQAWRDRDDFVPPPMDEAPPARSKKKLYAMGGALAVVVAGIAGTFVLRGGPSGNREAPVIKAAVGPAKILPAAEAPAPAQNASVLDRGVDRLPASRVTGAVEQPVEIASQPRTRAVASADQPPANGVFPEPRRVKTVSVRPDGSIIDSDIPVVSTQPAAPPAPPARPVSAGFPVPPVAVASVPAPSAPRPAAATPKVTARVAVRTPAPAGDDDDLAPVKAPTAAKPAPPKPAAPKPAAEQKPVAGGGGFAVQLASAGSDADAREKASQVQARLGSSLGGRRAVVVKGDANGKTVWRVRIVGLSQEGAADLCTKIKGAGSECFVAR